MLIKQSATAHHVVFFMVDSSDHVTGKTGLSPTVTLSKNAGAFAAPSGAITEISSGWYKLAGNATDTGTLGVLALHATGTGADATDMIVGEVVAFDPQNATTLGLTNIDATTSSRMATFTLPTNFSSLSIDGSGRTDVIKVAGTTQTARDLGTSVLLSSGTGTGQLDFTSGVVKSNMTQVNGGACPAVSVTGVPKVDVAYLLGTAWLTPGTAGTPDVNTKLVGGTAQTARDLGANIDAATSSRMATYTQPTGFLAATFPSGTVANTTNITAAAGITLTNNLRIQKNVAYSNFSFVMIGSPDHITPTAGLTVTGQVSLDGAAFATLTNAVTEIASGWYKVNLAAADVNANAVALRFTATGADPTNIFLATQTA